MLAAKKLRWQLLVPNAYGFAHLHVTYDSRFNKQTGREYLNNPDRINSIN